MHLKETPDIILSPSADMHVHLRQDSMMSLVVPTIRAGGVDTVFVMPNLQPPITTVGHALEYRAQLQALEPRVHYLMSLYLHTSITPETIAEAAKAGIAGVKVYPQGVTTNSAAGVSSYEAFYPVFAAMETHDLVLNLHGEMPSSPGSDVTVMNAEEAFLPTLRELHQKFPKLRIVLEHCTTAVAVDTVLSCGANVAATITAHHLHLTSEDWRRDAFAFCKPVAKEPADRDALLNAVISGNPKFFFGSDSAPHPIIAKRGGKSGTDEPAAGVFTQPVATQYVLLALEEAIERGAINEEEVTLERLAQFMGGFGRKFYRLPQASKTTKIHLRKDGTKVPISIKEDSTGLEVAISRAGSAIRSLTWVES